MDKCQSYMVKYIYNKQEGFMMLSIYEIVYFLSGKPNEYELYNETNDYCLSFDTLESARDHCNIHEDEYIVYLWGDWEILPWDVEYDNRKHLNVGRV